MPKRETHRFLSTDALADQENKKKIGKKALAFPEHVLITSPCVILNSNEIRCVTEGKDYGLIILRIVLHWFTILWMPLTSL